MPPDIPMAPRAIDNSIAILGRTTPGNATCGVLLISRTLIAVRKNYLTPPADAWRSTAKRNVEP